MANWQNKVVVITGGSDGLGLALVQAFANRGAGVASLARNETRNQEVADKLPENCLFLPVTADVTEPPDVIAAVQEIVEKFGRIDVWINNVGRSTRADILTTEADQYRAFLEINFLSAVNCWNACHQQLQKNSGTLVNIGSLASKTGWPLMAPYSTSKHALAAFSHQVRLEGPEQVNCLHVCPGPIRRPDAGARYDGPAKQLGERAKLAGAGTTVRGIQPEKIAEKIVRAIEKQKKELVIPWSARLLFSITQLSPWLGDALLKRFVKK